MTSKGQSNKVMWSVWAVLGPMAHKSKTSSRSIIKIGRRGPHDTCYTAHQFQGQKVKGQGHRLTNADTQNVPYLLNSKA